MNTKKRSSLNESKLQWRLKCLAQRRGSKAYSTIQKPKGMKRMMEGKASSQLQPITPKELYQARRNDLAIGKVIQYKQSDQPP